MGGRRGEGGDETRADGHEDGTGDHERHVVAQFPREQAGAHGRGRHGKDEREDHDAGFHGGDALDRLEPEGQEVEEGDHGAADGEGEGRPREDAAVQEDAGRDGRGVALAMLDEDEDREAQGEEEEENDDARVRPSVGQAAPLEGEEEADDGGQEEERADRVQAVEFFAEGGRLELEVLFGDVQEEDVDRQRRARQGKVDVEAPAPAWAACEGSAQQRTDCACDAEYHADEAGVLRAFVEWDDVDDDDDAACRKGGFLSVCDLRLQARDAQLVPTHPERGLRFPVQR